MLLFSKRADNILRQSFQSCDVVVNHLRRLFFLPF